MISETMQKALNQQIKEELQSAYLYFAMAADFESKGLDGFASWMTAQASEEMVHAMKIYTFINDRGGKAHLLQLDEPQSSWKSTLEAFEAAYKHEQYITDCINKLVKKARDENDNATENMLQWFVNEQVEEEKTADDIVSKLKMVGDHPQGTFMMNSQLGNRTPVNPFVPPAGGAGE